jgi:DNA-binding NtrC family response regulator
MQELAAALKHAPFDLLITDLHMEEDTAENIISRVKETSPLVKVLFMSGASYKTDGDNFIEKPFKLDDLREKVRACLNEPV